MKKILLLLVVILALNSCSLDGTEQSTEVLLPVEVVEMPDEDSFAVNNLSTIKVKFRRPTNCHIFNGFNSSIVGNTATIAVRAIIFDQDNCVDDNEALYEMPLQYTPSAAGIYTFKFWTGDDENGIAQFIVYDVVVQ